MLYIIIYLAKMETTGQNTLYLNGIFIIDLTNMKTLGQTDLCSRVIFRCDVVCYDFLEIMMFGSFVSSLPLSTIVLLNFGAVRTVWYLFIFRCIVCIYAYCYPSLIPYDMMFVSSKSNTMGHRSRAGIAYPPAVFCRARVAQCLGFRAVVSQSLFVFFSAVIVLSVFYRCTSSDYPLGIFNLFICYKMSVLCTCRKSKVIGLSN